MPVALNLATHEQLAGSLSKRHAVRRVNASSNRMYAHGFRFYFIPLSGCFSPFPHGTTTLSVICSYLALEGGPPCFRQDFTCPALLWIHTLALKLRLKDYHLLRLGFPSRFVSLPRNKSTSATPVKPVWAIPRSLATTKGISVDFFSSGY